MNFLFPYMARWKAVNWTRYHQLFTHLAMEGHNVYVLQPPHADINETNFQEIEVDIPENLRLIDVPVNPHFWNRNLPFNKLIKKGMYSLVSIRQVKKLVKELNIDVLFLYNIPQYPLLNIQGCIKIFDFADDYIAMLEHELGLFSNRFIIKIAAMMLEKMIARSDICFSVSHELSCSLPWKEKNHILPNGVELVSRDERMVGEISSKYKAPIIGFIGSFEYFIDFELMLDVAEKLPAYTFLLVGGGREFSAVESRVKDKGLKNVVLTGGKPHDQVMQYIAAMDICLNVFKKIPISHGACPIKLFEYLSMRKPVISTRLKEVEAIDKDFLFYADTVEEMTGQITRILSDKKTVTTRVEKGYNIVNNEYQWSAITQRLLSIIDKIKR